MSADNKESFPQLVTDQGKPLIGMIWAADQQGTIGDGAAMPWHVPEDMRFFVQCTRGCPVLMGRATWESLSPDFRPLPGRENIVLSRTTTDFPGAQAVDSFDAGLDALENGIQQRRLKISPTDLTTPIANTVDALPAPLPVEAWVLGGGNVYQQAAESARVDVCVVTDLDIDATSQVQQPVTAPQITDWNTVWCGPWKDSSNAKVGIGSDLSAQPMRYRFRVLQRTAHEQTR